MLQRQGYTVGTRRVARLMRENHLLVAVKRASCRTTQSLQGEKPWNNRIENLKVSREDQVWVADITYVRLKGRFIYLALLMDVFTRVIKAWQIHQYLNSSLTLKPLQQAFCHSVCEIHHSDQGVQYLSNDYLSTLRHHDVKISVARRGCPWENGYTERLIRTFKEEEVHLNDYDCTAYGFLDHTLNQDCAIITTSQKKSPKRPHAAL